MELPQSFKIGSRRCFKRSEIEYLKAKIIAEATGGMTPEYVAPEVEAFVNASTVARELGISRRTMSRRISGHTGKYEIAS